MLFAEGTADSTWIVVGLAAVSTLGGTGAALFAWLNARDNKRYDLRVATLETNVAECQERHEQCEEQHAVTRTELKAAKEDAKARDARDKAELQAQIDTLKKQVNGSH